MSTIHYSNGAADTYVIDIWQDLHNERPGYLRAFWVNKADMPTPVSGSPVVGYCSPGGSYRTIREVIAECRRLGYGDPIYRNGKQVA